MNKDIQNRLGIASKIDEDKASELFGAVMKLNICLGNADFVDLIQHKEQSSGNHSTIQRSRQWNADVN